MRAVVLDTDVSSKILKRRLTERLATKADRRHLVRHVRDRRRAVAVGLHPPLEPPTREQLEDWLSGVVVLDSDDTVSRTWGQICADARLRGDTRPVNDSWIAACCLANDLPLATLNTKDFTGFAEHNGGPGRNTTRTECLRRHHSYAPGTYASPPQPGS